MEVLAIIPARGGSKGIPKKNLRKVGGLSLVARSVVTARESDRVTRVVVSTDCDDISSEAEAFGAEVVKRPADISGDAASSESALLHVLQHLEAQENYQPEIVVFLQCTSPLTQPEDIDGTVAAIVENDADAAFAAIDFHFFVWRKDETGGWGGANHDASVRQMRQERPEEVLEAGAVYVMRTEPFLTQKHRFCGKLAVWKMPRTRLLEIDDPEDLTLAMKLVDQETGFRMPFWPEAVVFDFDGVLTDNRVWLDKSGNELVACSRGDGFGIEMMKNNNIPVLILSKETDGVVGARAGKLRVDVIQSCDDKLPALKDWAAAKAVPLNKIVYVGNDLNDLECMTAVGCAVAPADGHPVVKTAAAYITRADGGFGVARELAQTILRSLEDTE